jgi:integrase
MRLGVPGVGSRADNALLLSLACESNSRASEVPLSARGGGGARRRVALGESSLGALSDARGGVMSELLLDAAGRRRSPATLPEFHAGRPPRNKGMRYPADPPAIEEIVAVMRRAGDTVHGQRLRGLIVVLWRAGLRIHEALALAEADLDPRRGSLLVRRGKGGRRRLVGMDDWAWEQLAPWLKARVELPVGRCSASSTARPADGRGRPPRRAPSCGTWRARPACGGASRRTSCATPTPSRWPARACR